MANVFKALKGLGADAMSAMRKNQMGAAMKRVNSRKKMRASSGAAISESEMKAWGRK